MRTGTRVSPTVAARTHGSCPAMSAHGRCRQRGVTLVELVMVIVILGVAAVAIMDQFVNSARTYEINESVQTAAQLAQECAEHILATRRLQGYAAITPTCPALPGAFTAAGYASAATFGGAPAACATPPSCTQVDVVVTQSGTERARVVFMLGNY